MARQMNLTDAKARLSEAVDDVHRTHEEIEISRNGQVVAVLISTERLESLRETLEVLSDRDLLDDLHEALDDVNEGRVYSGESVKRGLDARVAAEQRPRRAG